MATFAGLEASLTRTRLSLARLVRSKSKLEQRKRALNRMAEEIRAELKTGRGQKIRGQLSRAVRAADALIQDIEFMQIRIERIRFKLRNLVLDVNFGLPPYASLFKSRLLKQAEDLNREIRKISNDLKPIQKVSSELRVEFKQASVKAEWHYKIDHCVDLFRSGYDELGLRSLLVLCYGPNTPPDHRRRALNELLSWGHTVADNKLVQIAGDHLASYTTPADKASASERELVLRLEGLRAKDELGSSEAFLLLQDAARRATEDALLAAANLVSGLTFDGITEIGAELQLLWINKALAFHKLEPITVDLSSPNRFDTLDCEIDPSTRVENGALVTVIVPAWNSESWLGTAVRGLTKQSWRNLEIIIVDDCSEDGTLATARRLAQQDSRIKVLANEVNRGAYASRNLALSVSSGDYITVHDADDWSHPRKIERQVAHLEKNLQIQANLTQSVRIEPDSLLFFAQYGREIVRQNSSSLMFRRTPVFEELGYWDEVKFGADTEFHHRIRARFGANTAPVAKLGLLSLTRYHAESLTGGGKFSTQRGIVGARRDYLGKFQAWHGTLASDESASLYMGRAIEERPFPIPTSSSVDENSKSHFDVVVFANLSLETPWLLKCYTLARKLKSAGREVAFMHLPGLERPTQAIGKDFERLVAEEGARRIYAENDCQAQRVLVQASVLRTANVLMPSVSASQTDVIYDDLSISVDLESATSLAQNLFGSSPVVFGADRETKNIVSGHKDRISVSPKVWKFD